MNIKNLSLKVKLQVQSHTFYLHSSTVSLPVPNTHLFTQQLMTRGHAGPSSAPGEQDRCDSDILCLCNSFHSYFLYTQVQSSCYHKMEECGAHLPHAVWSEKDFMEFMIKGTSALVSVPSQCVKQVAPLPEEQRVKGLMLFPTTTQ